MYQDPNNDFDDITRDFNKLEQQSEKFGLSEGLSDGKEKTLQTSFDAGYKVGFRYGLAVGRIRGALTAKQHENKEENQPPDEQGQLTVDCQLCTNDSLMEKSISEIEQLQKDMFDKNLAEFNTKTS